MNKANVAMRRKRIKYGCCRTVDIRLHRVRVQQQMEMDLSPCVIVVQLVASSRHNEASGATLRTTCVPSGDSVLIF